MHLSSIGYKVKQLRKKEGISQEELARVLDVTKSTISKYELGQRELSALQLVKLLNYFGIEKGLYLLDPDDPQMEEWNDYVMETFWNEQFRKKEQQISAHQQQLINAFFQLNNEGQIKAVERVEELTEIPKYKNESSQNQSGEEGTE